MVVAVIRGVGMAVGGPGGMGMGVDMNAGRMGVIVVGFVSNAMHVRMVVPGAVGVDVFVGVLDVDRRFPFDQLHRLGWRGLEGVHAESFHLTAAAFCTHVANSG